MKNEKDIKEFISNIKDEKMDSAKDKFNTMVTERLNERMSQIRKRVSASFLNGSKNG